MKSRIQDRRRSAHPRGSVLLLVLVLIVVTAAAVEKFAERALSEMAGEGYHLQRAHLRGEAYSALEATLGVLAMYREIDGGIYSPAQGWDDPLSIAEYQPTEGREVSVTFQDENSKLSLRHPEEAVSALESLFTELGFKAGEVEILTDSLLDWIDADDSTRPYGAETDDYTRTDPPHVASNKPLRTFAELSAINGFADLMFTATGRPNGRCEAFMQRVSLWSSGTINLNTASPTLLRSCGLMNEGQITALDRAREPLDGGRGDSPPRYYKSLGELSAQVGALPSDGVFGVRSEALGIIVTVRERQSEFRLRAVVRTDVSSGASGRQPNQRPPANSPGKATFSQKSSEQGGRGNTGQAVDYPFQFLELAEDPPPVSMSPEQSNP